MVYRLYRPNKGRTQLNLEKIANQKEKKECLWMLILSPFRISKRPEIATK
jgi:hypothetical protein